MSALFFYTAASFWFVVAIVIAICMILALVFATYGAYTHSRNYIYLKLLAIHGIDYEDTVTMRRLFDGLHSTPETNKIIVRNIVKIGKDL